MVSSQKRSPAERLKRLWVKTSWGRDLLLLLRIGWFIRHVPADLDRLDLPRFLARIESGPRPRATDVSSAHGKIVRLRSLWLARSFFRDRDNCYLRALTLYRFLDPGKGDLSFHVGLEPPRFAGDRLRGHAWVTLDGTMLEAPPEVAIGRVREVNLDPVAR